MAAQRGETPWRQGHVLSNHDAKTLGLVADDAPAETIVVVISHDCDFAQPPEKEPVIEVIIAGQVETASGTYTHGKNARRLHLTFDGGSTELHVELNAACKRALAKERLAAHVPVDEIRLTPHGRDILQRWLAARYRRSAFPDEFNRRLDVTGLGAQLGKVLKRFGREIAAIFLDVDRGEDVERSGADDPYELRIYLLYITQTDPDGAHAAAQMAAAAIQEAFRAKCLSDQHGLWQNFELVACEAIADETMTFRQAADLKKWNADHISLKADPPQPMVSDT